MKQMKAIIGTILFLYSISLFCQETIYFDKDWQETNKEDAFFYRNISSLDDSFVIRDYFIDGQLQFEGVSSTKTEPLILQGEAVWYDEDGIIMQVGNFKNNRFHGEVKSYYPNGKIKSFGAYVLGELEGLYTEYFPTGEIQNQANFSNNQIDGTHIKYRNPDSLEFKIDYKDGVIHGSYMFYNSNGTLFNKGTVVEGVKNGKCYDYYYEGELRREYIIKDGFLDGKFIEYNREGSVTTHGVFNEGKVISFESMSLGTTNNSKFSSSMKLKKGIEQWKVYRDDKLILKSYYKNGHKTSEWEVFSYNGSELYQTINFDINSDCKEEYLQGVKGEFDPFLFLSNRFAFDIEMIEQEDCTGVYVTQVSENEDEHPFYYFKEK